MVDEDSGDNDVTADHPRQRQRRRRRRRSPSATSPTPPAGRSTWTPAWSPSRPTPTCAVTAYGSFDYEISDGNGGTDSAHAAVDVICVQRRPGRGRRRSPPAPRTRTSSSTATTSPATTPTSTPTRSRSPRVANLVGGTPSVGARRRHLHPGRRPVRPRASPASTTPSRDGNGGTDTAHVSSISPASTMPPSASTTRAWSTRHGPADYDVLGNDTDVEDDTLSRSRPRSPGRRARPASSRARSGSRRPPRSHGQAVITYTLTDGDSTRHGDADRHRRRPTSMPRWRSPAHGRLRQRPRQPDGSAADLVVRLRCRVGHRHATRSRSASRGAAFKPVYSGPRRPSTKVLPVQAVARLARPRDRQRGQRLGAGSVSATRKIVAYPEQQRKS